MEEKKGNRTRLEDLDLTNEETVLVPADRDYNPNHTKTQENHGVKSEIIQQDEDRVNEARDFVNENKK